MKRPKKKLLNLIQNLRMMEALEILNLEGWDVIIQQKKKLVKRVPRK